MAFASTITDRGAMARTRVNMGTFESSGSGTGGDINTGLTRCEHITFTVLAASVGNHPVVNETLPCAGKAVTIVTDSNEVGTWEARGR